MVIYPKRLAANDKTAIARVTGTVNSDDRNTFAGLTAIGEKQEAITETLETASRMLEAIAGKPGTITDRAVDTKKRAPYIGNPRTKVIISADRPSAATPHQDRLSGEAGLHRAGHRRRRESVYRYHAAQRQVV